MPTYGYRCDQGGHEFEVVQSISEAPLTSCLECGAPVHRIFYPVGIVFKGQGFYKTDSRKGDSGGASPSSSSSSSSSASKSAESKLPAEASPAKDGGASKGGTPKAAAG
jgi:putative FmdB family regulatory protein